MIKDNEYIADKDKVKSLLPFVKAGMENTREGYKKALESDIPKIKINEEALKTIADEIKKDL